MYDKMLKTSKSTNVSTEFQKNVYELMLDTSSRLAVIQSNVFIHISQMHISAFTHFENEC